MTFPFPISESFAEAGKRPYRERLTKDERYRIGPFYCAKSRSTHKGPDKYAIDFLVEEHTPVLAVASGRVFDIKEHFRGYGRDPSYKDKLNYIIIQHDDGFFSQYIHLEYYSCAECQVKIGDKVRKGDPIGKVANNGYMIFDEGKSPLTHLHFMVFKVAAGTYQTIKVKFKLSLKYRIKFFFELLWRDPEKVFRDFIDNYLAAN